MNRMATTAAFGFIVLLLLALSATPASAQNNGNSRAAAKQSLEGKVSRYYNRAEGPKLSKRKVDFAPIVADPNLAAELAETPPKILSAEEYEALKEERADRMRSRIGRSLGVQESGWAEAYEGESAERNTFVKNEDASDDSLKFLLWLVGGVASVGLAFFFWRRSL